MTAFPPFLVLDQDTGDVLPGAVGQVFDPADVDRATPLDVTDANGAPIPGNVVAANLHGVVNGIYTVRDDLVEVVWVSGQWTFRISSLTGVRAIAIEAKQLAANSAASAAGSAELATQARADTAAALDAAGIVPKPETSADSTLATYVRTAATATGTALRDLFVRASGRSVDATNAPGVDSTGAVECSAAIQAVLDANAKTGDGFARTVRLRGTFNIASTLVVKGHVDFSTAVFRYSGSGTAIRVGDPSVGQLRRVRIRIGEVICTSKPATAGSWLAGTVGLELRNASVAHVEFTRIFNFETGLALIGDGSYGVAHTAYNRIMLGHLDNNLTNETLQCIAGATYPFVNQNAHYGGTMSHTEGTAPVAGMRHILIGSDADNYASNANTWHGTSLEGGREQWTIECHGTENTWDTCRYEFVPPGGTATGAPVYFGPKAARNIINSGYMVDNIIVTDAAPVAGDPLRESGSLSNQIIGNRHMEYETVGTIGVGLSAGGGNTSPVLSVLPNAWRRLALDPATKWIMRVLGTGALHMKNSADSHSRIIVDPVTRAITFGGGFDATSIRVIGADYHNGGVAAVGPLQGSLRFNYHPSNPFGLFIKTPLSTSSWQNVGFPPVTTATRPAPANAGVGGAVFNTDTGRPEWSNGTNWVDAMGTVL